MVPRDCRNGILAVVLFLMATSCAASQEAGVAPALPTTSANIEASLDSPAPSTDSVQATEPSSVRAQPEPVPSNGSPKDAPQVEATAGAHMNAEQVSSESSFVAAERRSVEALDRVSAIIPYKHEKRGAVITLLTDDLFEPGDCRLSSTAGTRLDELAVALRLQGDKKIEIDGFTDSLGDAAENDDLSKKRADALRDYFARKGVDRSKMKTDGLGSRRPAADNATSFGRAQNRRVEIVIENAPRAGSESKGASIVRAEPRIGSS